MKRLLLLLGAIVGLIVVVEIAAPGFVAARAESAIAEETRGRMLVDVDVSGPPLVLPVIVDGTVATFAMTLQEVAGQDTPVDIRLELTDVVLERAPLFRGEVRVRRIGGGSVVVRIDLTASVPAPLRDMTDRLDEIGLDRLLGALDDGFAEATGSTITVGGLDIPVGSCVSDATDRVVTTTCDLDRLPDFLVRSLQP